MPIQNLKIKDAKIDNVKVVSNITLGQVIIVKSGILCSVLTLNNANSLLHLVTRFLSYYLIETENTVVAIHFVRSNFGYPVFVK